MSEKLAQAIADAKVVLAAMRERAKELETTGVAEVITLDLVRQLSEISDEEFTDLSLFELIKELISDSETVPLISMVLLDVIGKIERRPDKENRGPDDEGTSYGAFATGKLFYSLRTGENSQNKQPVRRGESQARGSLIARRIAASFSGGTEVQDADISSMGIMAYESLMVDRWQRQFAEQFNFSGKVLGEKADEEAIREQYTVFLKKDPMTGALLEEIVEVTLADGQVLLVQKNI
ncbi:MAG: hypothetical protein ACOZAK_02995 [Patescibacteria group bacterium]